MASFPDIEDPSKLTETDVSFRIKAISSAGYTMLAASSTLTKKEFVLEWAVMATADKNALSTFFITNNSSIVAWAHPEDLITYDTVFKDDKLKFEYISDGYWKVKLTLLER